MEDEPKMMKVSIEANGEFITTEIPITSAVQADFEDGHLRGIKTLVPGETVG